MTSMTWLSTWRRLLLTTAIGFVLLLGLLAYRVHAGVDPVLARVAATRAAATTTPSAGTADGRAAAVPEDPGAQGSVPTTQAS